MSEIITLPDHSAAKVQLLGAYLKRFLSVISNDGFTEQIDIYDLFCGDGQGSPSVIMREVKNSFFARQARSQKNPVVNAIFNDINNTKVEHAKGLLSDRKLHYPEMGSLSFSSRDYADLIADLNSNLVFSKFKKTFVFIDPYGYKKIKASDIQNLLEKGNVEVLLFLPTQFMYRFDSNGTPEALKDFVDEIVSISEWVPNESVWKYIEKLKAGFRNKLGPRIFVDTFTIQKDPQTIFCLFFFSGHIKGFEKMLEAKWELDEEQGKGWHYYRSQSSGLFVDQKAHPLEEKLREFLSNSERSNGEVFEFTLACGFLPKHTKEVFDDLQKRGELSVLTSIGEKIRRGAFYINYKTFRDDAKKVTFRII